jgi:hypothetical protein
LPETGCPIKPAELETALERRAIPGGVVRELGEFEAGLMARVDV